MTPSFLKIQIHDSYDGLRADLEYVFPPRLTSGGVDRGSNLDQAPAFVDKVLEFLFMHDNITSCWQQQQQTRTRDRSLRPALARALTCPGDSPRASNLDVDRCDFGIVRLRHLRRARCFRGVFSASAPTASWRGRATVREDPDEGSRGASTA